MAKSKDLFDDSSMSFGEHLEILRTHLIRALMGVAIGVVATLYFGDELIDLIQRPIKGALKQYSKEQTVEEDENLSAWERFKKAFTGGVSFFDYDEEEEETEKSQPLDPQTLRVRIPAKQLAQALHELDSGKYPPPGEEGAGKKEKTVSLNITAPEFAQLQRVIDRADDTIAINVQEAFMTYLKVSIVGGLVLSSPWVFYQTWLFVAAGLYPHERKYVYIYLPMSMFLFLGGVLFCFFIVFPFVLNFLLGFNRMLGINPQIRLSEWISFAIMLPLMFGISFQLPLVMRFLERISVFDVETYRSKRRMAILVIAILSMFLTPADPMSMIAMMLPMTVLYELGIYLCKFSAAKSPFEGEAA